jgi:hypothetical protein
MNPVLKALLIAAAIPVYLVAGLYLSVGVGDWTGNANNTAFAALVLLVVGVVALVKGIGRRRSGAQA